MTKEKKTSEREKEINVEDIFSDVEDDGLFRGMREAPPPLVYDDDDEEYDELFMTRKKKENTPSKISHSGSVIAVLESFPRENPLLSRHPHSTASALGYSSSFSPKEKDIEDDFIFSTNGSLRSNPISLFPSPVEPNEAITDEYLFNQSTKHSTVVTDTLIRSDIPAKKPLNSILETSSHVKDIKDDYLSSHSVLSHEEDSSLFGKPAKLSSDLFSAPVESYSRVMSNKPAGKNKEDESMTSDDELFGSQTKPSKAGSSDIKTLVR